MSFTGRFDPDFNKADSLPSAQLPRDTLAEIAARLAREAAEAEEEEDGG